MAWKLRVAGSLGAPGPCASRAPCARPWRVRRWSSADARRRWRAPPGATGAPRHTGTARRRYRLRGRVHEIGRARPVLAHAHVERTIDGEGETACRLIELHRRNADIHDNAVDPRNSRFGERGDHFGEAARMEDKAGRIFARFGPFAPGFDRIGIAIEGVDGGAGIEQAAGIAARAERGIDDQPRPAAGASAAITSSSRTGTCGAVTPCAPGPRPRRQGGGRKPAPLPSPRPSHSACPAPRSR
jgi:hypothetical protein